MDDRQGLRADERLLLGASNVQFFDHHLKGEPAPAWMTEGVPYRGE
jgi:hypothetical protein